MKKEEVLKIINVFAFISLILYFICEFEWLIWFAFIFILLNFIDTFIDTKISLLIAKYWLKFSLFVGRINLKIILFLTFYLILTPLAFIYRIFNKKQVCHFKSKKKDTYFIDVNLSYNKEKFEKMW